MLVKDGKIAFIGTEAEAEGLIVDGETKVVDVGGMTILPGMHDVHLHPLEAGSTIGGTCGMKPDTRFCSR